MNAATDKWFQTYAKLNNIDMTNKLLNHYYYLFLLLLAETHEGGKTELGKKNITIFNRNRNIFLQISLFRFHASAPNFVYFSMFYFSCLK